MLAYHFGYLYSASRPSHFVILSSILLGSRIKVGRTTRLRSAPGRNCEMICERTARHVSNTIVFRGQPQTNHCPDLVLQPFRLRHHSIAPHRPKTYCLIEPLATLYLSAQVCDIAQPAVINIREFCVLAPEARRCECMLTILAVLLRLLGMVGLS